MAFLFLQDPSFWILISFLLLVGTFSTRILKKLNQQLKTRQEAIARQISEVGALYEEANMLFLEEKNNLAKKEQEVSLLTTETLKEIDRKKQILRGNIKNLHQKCEDTLHQKKEAIKEKYITKIEKKMLEDCCARAENDLKKTLGRKTDTTLIETKIEKMSL